MGVTPSLGFHYPEDTDPVNQGAQAIKALATEVEAVLPRVIAGAGSVDATNLSQIVIPVDFGGVFTAPPFVTANAYYPPTALQYTVQITGNSAGGCALVLTEVGARPGSGTVYAHWIAVEDVSTRPGRDPVDRGDLTVPPFTGTVE